ncbi:dihydrodipicolinate synthase family protein [Symbioplanes lichenis]|uniref:dihydrodipicolinate synthase family protein n=1 Tax=Symbioplanes lichenis TaxID=1629072 RepID=UPI002738E2C4|nr:dihydrodipicolinate synthase family protein [Actinoplanes lichenis]
MTFDGVYVPMITPFDDAGAVQPEVLRRLAHEVLDGGARGLVALGTTGGPSSLSAAERAGVLDVLTRVCRDRDAPLIVGAGEAVPGSAAVLSVVPPFVRPGEDGVVAYFAQLAARSPVPVLIYHVPYRTAQPLSAATVHRLAALPGVTGMKLAPGGIDAETVALLADPPPGFAILGGDDPYLPAMLALGAAGGIVASAHVETAAFVSLADAWARGDVPRARGLGHRLTRLALQLFAHPNPVGVKAALHADGRIPSPHVRLPLLTAAA